MYYQSSARREPTRRVWWAAGSALAAGLLLAVLIAAAYAAGSDPDRAPAGDAAGPAPAASAAEEPEADSGDPGSTQGSAAEPETPSGGNEDTGDAGQPESEGSEGSERSDNGDQGSEQSGNGEQGSEQDSAQRQLVITDDPDALDGFLDRWQGEVLASVDPADADQPGVPAYLVSIDGAAGDRSRLAAEVQQLESAAVANMLRISEDTELGGVVAGGRGDGPQVAQEKGGSDDGSTEDDGASCLAGDTFAKLADLAYLAAGDFFVAGDEGGSATLSDLAQRLDNAATSPGGCEITFEADDAGDGEQAE